MLKIKDNVDLKELEKFGFENKNSYYEKQFGNKEQEGYYQWDVSITVDVNSKIILCSAFISSNGQEDVSEHDYINLDILYDLIKANLVEKE